MRLLHSPVGGGNACPCLESSMTTLRWSLADLAIFPEHNGKRYEIIDGELYVHAPSWEHQIVAGRLYAWLLFWTESGGSGIPNAAPGLIFADDDNTIPDVVWISAERLRVAL